MSRPATPHAPDGKGMSRARTTLVVVIVAVVAVAAILLWSGWRKSVTAETAAEQATVQTQRNPAHERKQNVKKPVAEPDTTEEQVREHATQVARQMNQLASYTVPGDAYSTYGYLAVNGKFNTTGLTSVENSLRDTVNESLHWADGHTGEENQNQVDLLDSKYESWQRVLWEAMCDCLTDTADALDEKLLYMDDSETADSCRNVAGLADSEPSGGSDEQSYVELRNWVTNVTNGLDQCQADMHDMMANGG